MFFIVLPVAELVQLVASLLATIPAQMNNKAFKCRLTFKYHKQPISWCIPKVGVIYNNSLFATSDL